MMRSKFIVALIVASACHGAAPGPQSPTTAPDPAGPPPRAGRAIAIHRGTQLGVHGEITAASLEDLLSRRFARQTAAGTFVANWNGTEDDVLGEIQAMGWTDLGEVARAIPDDFDVRGAVQFRLDDPANMPGLLRDFMILYDARRYFNEAWKDHWGSLASGDHEVYEAYRIDLAPLFAAGVMDGAVP